MGLALGFLLRSQIIHCLSIISDFSHAIDLRFTCWEGSLLSLPLISLTLFFFLFVFSLLAIYMHVNMGA
ncbi:hypothetical protein BDV30DRAFT_130006 [Aspergillus minisclerotigenes]|uniref:Uncharacterized protein n=1 Tax=Aspergillus minisclerotigenes TaxID=656917 RepID=A0A5N6J299_9EURO|nr:hypothetical protein BDV30DRAFT_130006 [Aspergillus minisclerotigenes]